MNKIKRGIARNKSFGLKRIMIKETPKNAPSQALLVKVRIKDKKDKKERNIQKILVIFLSIKVIAKNKQRERRTTPD